MPTRVSAPQAGLEGLALEARFDIFGIVESSSAVASLAALAQETRLDVFRLLVRSGSEGMAPGHLARLLELPPATLSFHLKELRSAGLVVCQQQGRSRLYQPDFDAVAQLIAFLTESCCQGVTR